MSVATGLPLAAFEDCDDDVIATYEQVAVDRWGHREEQGALTAELLHQLVRAQAKNPNSIQPFRYPRPDLSGADSVSASPTEMAKTLGEVKRG